VGLRMFGVAAPSSTIEFDGCLFLLVTRCVPVVSIRPGVVSRGWWLLCGFGDGFVCAAAVLVAAITRQAERIKVPQGS
jgi:hypothetical protein